MRARAAAPADQRPGGRGRLGGRRPQQDRGLVRGHHAEHHAGAAGDAAAEPALAGHGRQQRPDHGDRRSAAGRRHLHRRDLAAVLPDRAGRLEPGQRGPDRLLEGRAGRLRAAVQPGRPRPDLDQHHLRQSVPGAHQHPDGAAAADHSQRRFGPDPPGRRLAGRHVQHGITRNRTDALGDRGDLRRAGLRGDRDRPAAARRCRRRIRSTSRTRRSGRWAASAPSTST